MTVDTKMCKLLHTETGLSKSSAVSYVSRSRRVGSCPGHRLARRLPACLHLTLASVYMRCSNNDDNKHVVFFVPGFC